MPLKSSFPDLPPPRKPARVSSFPSNIPTADVPSVRNFQSYTDPLYPVPPPTANSVPLADPSSGYEARLFHCHCAPKCVEFVRPRDHPELQWARQVNQPLRCSVVASGPSATPNQPRQRTKLADFDVDSKVAYEFNSVGFYSELLSQLDRSHAELLTSNTRAQQFLHATRLKNPPRELGAPAYVPYYPTQHLAARGAAFVQPPPLADAQQVAANIAAPSSGSGGGGGGWGGSDQRSRYRFTSDFMGRADEEATPTAHWSRYAPTMQNDGDRELAQAQAAAVEYRAVAPSAPDAETEQQHMGLEESNPSTSALSHVAVAPPPAAAASAPSDDVSPSTVSAAVASARARLAQERLKFAEQMRAQLTASMTIQTTAATTGTGMAAAAGQ